MLQKYISCVLDLCFIYVSSRCCKCRSVVVYVAVTTYVASVLSGCCICCTGYTRMLQVHVSKVSTVLNVCCKCFIWICICCIAYTHMLQAYVVNVSSIFGHMLQQIKCFLRCKCFINRGRVGAQAEVVPSGAAVPACTKLGMEHKARRGA
jgi:hypothetical protein